MVARKRWIAVIGQAAGHPAALAVPIVYAAGWLMFDRSFDERAIAIIANFILWLVIHRAHRRRTETVHTKLDEQFRAQDFRLKEMEVKTPRNGEPTIFPDGRPSGTGIRRLDRRTRAWSEAMESHEWRCRMVSVAARSACLS